MKYNEVTGMKNNEIDYSYWTLYSTCKNLCKDDQEGFNVRMAKLREKYIENMNTKHKEVDNGTRDITIA
jgi:hypothetical protein